MLKESVAARLEKDVANVLILILMEHAQRDTFL